MCNLLWEVEATLSSLTSSGLQTSERECLYYQDRYDVQHWALTTLRIWCPPGTFDTQGSEGSWLQKE